MRSVIFFISLIFLTACPKKIPIRDPDCGGCGLKESGKKYERLKKGRK